MITKALVLAINPPDKAFKDSPVYEVIVGYQVKKFGYVKMQKHRVFTHERPKLHSWIEFYKLPMPKRELHFEENHVEN